MPKKKTGVSLIPDRFIRIPEMVTESGHLIERGDMIKVVGQHGMVFKFYNLVTNPEIEKTWVDCFEVQKGVTGAARSFYPEHIKAIQKRGKRVKRT
jgi:hypothetical protein